MNTIKHTITQVQNTNDIILDRPIENAQIMVKLSRNGEAWLSPTGWHPDVKSTLLDNTSDNDQARLRIPADFAAEIMTGDTLILSIATMDFEASLIWAAANEGSIADLKAAISSPNTIRAPAIAPKTQTKLKPRFIPSFGMKKPVEPVSEVEKLAQEAKRAAEKSMEDMRKAHKAKEIAEQRAIEAARLAEAAHRMELERIEQSKHAQQALLEAEAAKRAEEDRLERERLAEEARRAEVARQTELKRLEGEAARLEALRLVEVKRLQADHDDLQAKQSSHKAELATFSKTLNAAKSEFEELSAEAGKHEENFIKAKRKADAAHTALEREIKERDIIIAKAQALVDAKRSIANKVKSDLDALKSTVQGKNQERERLSNAYSQIQAKLSARGNSMAALKANIDTLKANNITAKTIQKWEKQGTNLSNFPSKIFSEFSGKTGGGAEKTIQVTHQPAEKNQPFWKRPARSTNPAQTKTVDAKTDVNSLTAKTETAKRLASNKPKTIKNSAPKIEISDIAAKGEIVTPKNIAIGVVAAMTTAGVVMLALPERTTGNKDVLSKVENIRVEPSSVLAASEQIDTKSDMKGAIRPVLPHQIHEIIQTKPQPETVYVARFSDISDTQNFSSQLQSMAGNVPANVSFAVKPVVIEPITTMSAAKNIPITKAKPTTAYVARFADIGNAPSFSSQLQAIAGTMPVGATVDVKPVRTKALVMRTKTVKSVVKNSKRKSRVKRQTSSANAARLRRTRKAANTKKDLTIKVQKRMKTLGFYSGPTTGKLDANTILAMNTFQNVFDLPSSSSITPQLLAELDGAGVETLANVATQGPTKIERAAPTALLAPTLGTQPFAQPTTVRPVTVTQAAALTLPQPTKSVSDFVEPKSGEAVADIIVAAKQVKGRPPEYPNIANGRMNKPVIIKINYDIDKTGKVSNVSVESYEGNSRWRKTFERVALKSVKSRHFDPKTINGIAVGSLDRSTRVVFQLE